MNSSPENTVTEQSKGIFITTGTFLHFIGKEPAAINDSDIKDYLLYLAEERQSATSTLNQAINALKFYYGSMLKKSFCMKSKDLARTKSCLLF